MARLTHTLRAPKAAARYHVFHHVVSDKHGPKVYMTDAEPEIRGAFIRFVDLEGQEQWLGGNITVRPIKA